MASKKFYLELPPDASPTLQLAGRELEYYVRTVFHWESLAAKSPDAYRLRLGTRRTSFAFRTFLNQVMQGLGDDGFRIVADATTTTFCAETDKGVLNSVYSFLMSVLRVRWAEPSSLGEVLPRREVRTWWPMDVVETPAFRLRGMHLAESAEGCADEDVRLQIEWMARNRLNHLVVSSNYSYDRLRATVVDECRLRGITLEVEANAHDQFLPVQLFDEHPEYFPVVAGLRTAASGLWRCASNEDAVALFVRNGVAWVREHPEADVIGLAPGATARPCECDACRKMKANEQWSRFLYPALAALRSEFPERQFSARAGIGTYDPLEPDAECRLGVATLFDTFIRCRWHELGSESCDVPTPRPELHDASRGATANVYLLNVLKQWKAIATAPVSVLESIADPALASQTAVNPEAVTRDMLSYRSLGLEGVVVRGNVRSFGSYLLNFNLFARLAWDSNANYRGVWPDLCVIYFGGYSFRVLDLVERLREAPEGVLSESEWRRIESLMAPVAPDPVDLFTTRYLRVRESVLYMHELARLSAAGAKLRKSRAEGNRAEAVKAARAAHKSFLAAWAIVERGAGSGMFDAPETLAAFILRGTNAEHLAAKFHGLAGPFWQTGDPARRLSFWDYVAKLEGEGLAVDDIRRRVSVQFAQWRDAFAGIAPRMEDVAGEIDFGFDRP